jgi:hypothetical protein
MEPAEDMARGLTSKASEQGQQVSFVAEHPLCNIQ